jgi:diguanylate cyclase (GGDEF)-like protein/PAS domain S-box-containing protein
MYRLFGRDPNLGPPSFPDDYRPFLHPDDWPQFESTMRRSTETGGPREEVFRIVQPGGGLKYLVSRFHVRRARNGQILAMAGTVQDITEHRLLEERLRHNEERYRIVASYTLDWEYWRALDGDFRYISPSCESVTGYRPEEFMADPDILVRIIHPDDRDAVISHLRDAAHSHDAFELDYRIVRRDGEVRWLAHVCRAVYGDDGKHLGRRISNRDITEKKRAAQELIELSLSDELTGLNNRRGFVTLATQQLIVADRLKQKLVLLYADLDDLKEINDQFGHKEGDRAILDIADVLKNSFRSADIIGRIGGDEFVGLAIESSDNATESIVARLKENINARNLRGDRPYKLSLSFGLTYHDVDAPCSLDELLERGDAQMYRQKQAHRGKRAT